MSPAGPLAGLRVVELASENAASAGKVLGDLGADVIVVEPPGGAATRAIGPFAGDRRDPEHSLWWWYYNTSKRSVTIDLAAAPDAFRELVRTADIVLEGERPGALAALGLDHPDLRHDALIWVSVTPFGRTGPRAHEEATDLTLLAGAGPVWSCGYDDHTVAPVRGGGNQAMHVAGAFAANAALVAVLHRDATGVGQHIDVSMHAALNVTTEGSSVTWLVAQQTVQRQTGRHAAVLPTTDVQVLAADGRYVTTGFPPTSATDFRVLLDWLAELGLLEEFDAHPFLEMGVERGGVDPRADLGDPLAEEIYRTGRDAMVFLATRMEAYPFFVAAQERDYQSGIVHTPDEALADPHLVARGFPVEVDHPQLGRPVTYPGAPFLMGATPWAIRRRAPLVGEHDAEVPGP
ncbi:MAG: CoA transferase [Pseudonocardia sp.]|nr:CoA transferase [Pseudonocardia sp.]